MQHLLQVLGSFQRLAGRLGIGEFGAFLVQGHGLLHQIGERGLVDRITLVQLVRAHALFLAFRQWLEELLGVLDQCALVEPYCDVLLERVEPDHDARVVEVRAVPFPGFLHVGIGRVDELTQPGQRFALPFGLLGDEEVDLLRDDHWQGELTSARPFRTTDFSGRIWCE